MCILTPSVSELTHKNDKRNHMEDTDDDKWEDNVINDDHLKWAVCLYFMFLWCKDKSSLGKIQITKKLFTTIHSNNII